MKDKTKFFLKCNMSEVSSKLVDLNFFSNILFLNNNPSGVLETMTFKQESCINAKSHFLFQQVHLLGQVRCVSEVLADNKNTEQYVAVNLYLKLVLVSEKFDHRVIGLKPAALKVRQDLK